MKLDKKSIAREKALKTIPFDAMTKSDINFLERQGIINGIGPESYGKVARWFMTKLFPMVEYKRHDVGFWQQNGFHEANRGLLKYSYLNIAKDYRKICNYKLYRKLYIIPLFYITLPFKVWIISLAYSAVESPAGKRAYNNCK